MNFDVHFNAKQTSSEFLLLLFKYQLLVLIITYFNQYSMITF